MDFITATILGIVEGITEFLPVSSTAHLILASGFLNIQQTDFHKVFEVVIQSGAILAVIIAYFKILFEKKHLMKLIFVSFIPTALVGFLMHDVIKNVFFESTYLIIFSMFFIGIVFLFLENLIKKGELKITRSLDTLTLKEAFIIGVGQSFAVMPGVSRAGIVIATMMFQRFRRDESALYSFLLAIPTILAASIFDLYKARDVVTATSANMQFLLIGFAVSLVTAYFAVNWLINYLKKNTLHVFAYYRIGLAIIMLAVLLGR